MKRCEDCTTSGLESECMSLGQCALHEPELTERWVPVPGYERFHHVSNLGRFRNMTCPRGRQVSVKVVSPIPTTHGPVVVLNEPQKGLPHRESVLLAEVLAWSLLGAVRGITITFKDGDPQNIKLANLSW